MSEPVSNAEIEDVLSSIRRLVSNDVEVSQEETANEPAEAEAVGKLILTADFRVSEPRDLQPEEASVPENDNSKQEDVQLEPVIEAPFEFRHTAQASEAEVEAEQEESNEVWQDPAELVEVSTSSEELHNPSSLEDTIADLEAAIGKQQGDWEPDGSDFEEDADAEEVMSEPMQDWIDGTAQEVDTEGDTEFDDTTTDTAADEPDLFGDEESVVDEEILRDMVSDIVRQELQGALGERITRNVRKLVRREINRILAAQDFD